MQPRLKRVDQGQANGPSQDLRPAETSNDLKPATQPTAVSVVEPSNRKPMNAEKFAYLRAQVHVFRRSR
jgi:hypothetical protein